MKLKLTLLAAAVTLVLSPQAAQAKSLSKEQAEGASTSRIYDEGRCKLYPWSTCDGVAADCARHADAMRCAVTWHGRRTDQMSGETTATWRCETTMVWRSGARGPKLVKRGSERCEDTAV